MKLNTSSSLFASSLAFIKSTSFIFKKIKRVVRLIVIDHTMHYKAVYL